MTDQQTADGPPRALLIAAVVVAVSVLITVLGIAAAHQRSPEHPPVAISSVPAPQANSPECGALLDGLPEQLGDFLRAPTVDPTPVGTAAWQGESGTEPVVLRCGLERPGDFIVGAPVQMVDDVQWFQVSDEGAAPGAAAAGTPEQARSTWYAVDRPVYVALTLPAGSGPTPIQLISAQITRTMPARAPDPGPLR
ncbi:DUF3515 domain-containing protein [Mycobacterium sp. 141]|uniref:DUF3515 domain-containing protein n=1 Tax=Mycobacterium sp. 141 TaxID=1120797 RepID=UPI000363CA70|nr:DUF3515 domain-containing protein [Mycobacterium sp. 141]